MKVHPPRSAKGLSMKKRKRHSAEQIVKKLRDADAMLASGKSVGEVLQSLEVSEATLSRWRSQYGGMKSEEAKRLKMLEEENSRLKKIIGDQALDIQMLKEIARGN
jgi:transposase-like protein